jgi:UDP-N-acetylglucosamine 2-epimerase (non-hydrolysing)
MGKAGRAVFVVGTRAQLIKVAPVIVRCEQLGQSPLLLLTGQHKETMQDILQEFGVRSERRFAVGDGERSTVGGLLAWLPRALLGVTAALRACARESGSPSVVVHGDTLSTFVGALAGRLVGGRVFHLESGLSSGRLFDPFPEEITRRLVFRLAHVALCPGPDAVDYMRRNHPRCEVIDTGGNTILDSVMLARRARPAPPSDGRHVVASLHRFQNIFDRRRFLALVAMIEALAVAVPVHFVLHPATRKRLESEGLGDRLSSLPLLTLSPRLGYADFLVLAGSAACVITDGGSNQEELAALGVPTIVMREHTERPDGLGRNALMEADVPGGVVDFILSGRTQSLRQPAEVGDDFGPSDACARSLA